MTRLARKPSTRCSARRRRGAIGSRIRKNSRGASLPPHTVDPPAFSSSPRGGVSSALLSRALVIAIISECGRRDATHSVPMPYACSIPVETICRHVKRRRCVRAHSVSAAVLLWAAGAANERAGLIEQPQPKRVNRRGGEADEWANRKEASIDNG